MAELCISATEELTNAISELRALHESKSLSDDEILQEIREICKGLALSDRARAARYDKIVEILKGEGNA